MPINPATAEKNDEKPASRVGCKYLGGPCGTIIEDDGENVTILTARREKKKIKLPQPKKKK